MSKPLNRIIPSGLRRGLTHRAWVFVALAIVFAFAVRVRLRDMSLERDEGEYAYLGQLLLQGVPPYRDAYNMKLPGTYLAYALSMAAFGQTPTGIHLGVAIVNAATIWLMFLLGRKLLDPVAGAGAAVTYALMSLSPDVLGLAGHATHFVVLPAVAGLLLLLRAVETRARKFHFLAGLLFGLAFIMKQHGVFFGLFGGVYLIWVRVSLRWFAVGDGGLGTRRYPRRRAGQKFQVEWSALFQDLAWFSLGCLLPYLGICVWLWAAGVFPQFWFWTVTYGSKYANGLPLVQASEMISYTLRSVVGPNLIFWLLPWVGALMMWWDERLDVNRRFLLAALFLFSLASISVGFYFRQHYFIQLLPAVALLIGLGVSRSLQLLRGDQSVELFLALGVVATAIIAATTVLFGNGAVWLTDSPQQAVEKIYHSTVFSDARAAADFIKANATPDARIAVLGSEPEIYFYSHRRSATGHIYTYALMEVHPYAAKMQGEMIQQIEAAKPEYMVFVNNQLSWLPRPQSERKIMTWWENYWAQNYSLVRTITTREFAEEFADQSPGPAGGTGNFLLILKRKH